MTEDNRGKKVTKAKRPFELKSEQCAKWRPQAPLGGFASDFEWFAAWYWEHAKALIDDMNEHIKEGVLSKRGKTRNNIGNAKLAETTFKLMDTYHNDGGIMWATMDYKKPGWILFDAIGIEAPKTDDN